MTRLDKRLQVLYPEFSRSRLEGLVKAGYVTVNGVVAGKAGMKTDDEDEIVVEIPPPVPAIPEPEDIPLSVIFEDEDLLVVDKASGMVVHPAPGHFTGTLVNALLHHCPHLSGIGGVARPGIVHRLDQDTSGLMVVAKSQAAMDGLVKAFATHATIEKTYLALAHGQPRVLSGRIENRIGRHPVDRKKMAIVEKNGKIAITNYEAVPRTVVGVDGKPVTLSRFVCRIETGRTHQIRVHLASLGCPIAGDRVYGKPVLDKSLQPVPTRQLLHAWKLKFWHPVRNVPLSFEAPIPAGLAAYDRFLIN